MATGDVRLHEVRRNGSVGPRAAAAVVYGECTAFICVDETHGRKVIVGAALSDETDIRRARVPDALAASAATTTGR